MVESTYQILWSGSGPVEAGYVRQKEGALRAGSEITVKAGAKAGRKYWGSLLQAGGKWQTSPLKAGSTKGPKPDDMCEKGQVKGRIRTWLGAFQTFMDDAMAAFELACLVRGRGEGHYYGPTGDDRGGTT